ncbi:MAG: glycosyltransferase family 2 protein [Gemmatimonadota bacterium]
MLLSVVVTVVDGGETLSRCLNALASQQGGPALDVIVPYDDSVPGMAALAEKFPAFKFLPMGTLQTQRPKFGPAGQHELFDRRRSAGLAVASGDLVAIVEDRGVPRPDWSRKVVELHARMPHAVIGGGVDNGRDRVLNWAVFFCDFGRYQPPFESGPREYVTDVNIGYKRRAIEQTRELWKDRYHETTVHWALIRAGETLFLSNEFAVDQMRDDLTIRRLMGERLGWGRLFAYTRARETGTGKRLVLAALAPVLPLVLFARLARQQARKRRTLGKFVLASPLVALLLAGWSLGEMTGYLTGRP